MSSYIRVAKGLAGQVSELVPSTQNIYEILKKNPKQDYYISLYRYNDKHFETFKETKSVAGFYGVTTPRILFDFDSKTDINLAKKDALELCARLVKHGVSEDRIRIFFSGYKGFGVELYTDQSFNRQEFINITQNLAQDLTTFDTKINDENRVIRLPLSRHPVSGLHKIPLHISELASLSVDEIKENAKDVSAYDINDLKDEKYLIKLPESINSLRFKTVKKLKEAVQETLKFDISDVDLSKCPKWMSKERFLLQEGFFYGSESVPVGERNSALLILAATYKNQGFSADHAYNLLLATIDKQAERTKETPYTDEQLDREVISVVYSPNWRGGIFSQDEELLVKTRQRFNLLEEHDKESNLVDIKNVGDGFKDFAKNINNNRILTGLSSLDKDLVLTTGMMMTVVSAPGGGKTAIANLLAETISKNQEDVLYFSLDLFKNLLFVRMIQRYINYDFQTILDQFESGNVDKDLLDAYSKVLENYSNVNFNFRSVTIDSLEEEIQNYTERKGKSPKLIIVDYLDKVKTQHSDATHSSSIVASRLSDISKKYSCLVMLLAQPSKFGSSGPNQEFKSYRSLKGSSTIESDSRVILGIHRPGYDPTDQSRDLYSTITILKNNTGRLASYDYAWDGLAGTFTELTLEQRRDLKRLKQELEEKESKNDKFDI